MEYDIEYNAEAPILYHYLESAAFIMRVLHLFVSAVGFEFEIYGSLCVCGSTTLQMQYALICICIRTCICICICGPDPKNVCLVSFTKPESY